MREMKDSGIEWIGEIPSDWKLERSQWHLEEVNISNNPIQTNNVLSLTNKLGVVPYEEKGNQGNKSKENVYEYKLAYPNTIVANSMNILIGSVGLCDYFGCVSPVYYVFRAKKDNNIKFLNYVFQTVGFQRELRKYANGILEIRLRVSSSDILKRFIPFPSEIEQQRIAEFLDRECGKIDGLKADIQVQIDTLEQYKRSVITEAVTHGLNPSTPMKDSGIPWVGDVPYHWVRGKIKNVTSMLGSGTTPISTIEEFYENGTINWIQSGDIYGKKYIENVSTQISQSAVSSTSTLKIYKQPFIVMAMYGGSVGNTAISLIDACTNQACCCIKPNEKTDFKFLYYWIVFCKEDFLIKAEGGGQPNISQYKIKNQIIYSPPLGEQQEIADYLDNKCAEIEQIIADKKSQIETLDGYKKSLIYEYVTGKKEVG